MLFISIAEKFVSLSNFKAFVIFKVEFNEGDLLLPQNEKLFLVLNSFKLKPN